MMHIYTVDVWLQLGDRGYKSEYTSKRSAMKAAAYDARRIGARRVTPHNEHEIARWRMLGGDGGVVVYEPESRLGVA